MKKNDCQRSGRKHLQSKISKPMRHLPPIRKETGLGTLPIQSSSSNPRRVAAEEVSPSISSSFCVCELIHL